MSSNRIGRVQTAQGARVLSLCRDISARKRNAEALRASEERYRTLAEASPDSISVISGDGVYEYANSNHARWFGHPSEDISGRHLTDLWPQASANRLLKEIRQILQAGVPAAIERPSLLHPARWVEMRWVPLPRADDKASSLLVVMRDITERKQAEAALRENESLLRAFYDSPGALRGIIELVEDDFRLLSANAALALSYGQPLEKILNCPASRLGMPQETLQLWIQHFQKSRRRGQPVTFEHWDEGKPKVRCLLVTVCFLGPAPGGPPRFGLVAMDITERKQAEAILAQLPRRLFEVQETERHRVSRELHDGVNQLLSSIKLRLHTAEEALPRPNKEARASLERCRELTAQVLEETRRISHALRPQSLEDLGLSAACRGLCEDFQSRTGLPVQYNDATLTTRLPATTELHLFRIVQEALNNIAKHAAATRVRVTLVVRKNGLELKIEDTGCGFNPRAPRVHGPKAHGLGLINFQERAAVLEGTCEIKSAPGKGTKIRVLVPLNKQPSTSPVSSPGSSSQTKTSSHDT